jgi:hypothetical protein
MSLQMPPAPMLRLLVRSGRYLLPDGRMRLLLLRTRLRFLPWRRVGILLYPRLLMLGLRTRVRPLRLRLRLH